ncbi:MAG: thymidine phosphorylase [Clostridia bacterium]|nr:thymidine phosphorylase [Clostridia bacterium]
MRIYDIIEKKKQGFVLSKDEIEFFISGYMSGEVADYQASALLMAICIKGMNEDETYYLTDAMLHSGDMVDLSCFGDLTVDKHSTGGVGDKTTLIVAPIVASLGCKVAKMSGRGLGFTGGTVDKLESISGYRATLSASEFLSQVERIGICVTGQSGNLAPADKKLYALRDVTATIESIPLIASSIMSKKLASGSKNIVLDVKCGSGAFMKDVESARALASAMINIGKRFGRRICAVISNMDAPLGYFVGNSLEVYEAIQVLQGKGEHRLTELCVTLATQMVSLAHSISESEAKGLVQDAISSGRALDKMKEWIGAQGGDVSIFENPEVLKGAKYKKAILGDWDGFICSLPADKVGKASMLLGAGRTKKEDSIDPYAGIELDFSYGSKIYYNEPMGYMYSSRDDMFDSDFDTIDYTLTHDLPSIEPIIYDILR